MNGVHKGQAQASIQHDAHTDEPPTARTVLVAVPLVLACIFAVRLVFCGDAQHGCMVFTASLGWGKP